MRAFLLPAVVLALVVTFTAAAGAPQVTITMRQVVTAPPLQAGGIPTRQTILSGAVANGAPGETVGVLARECGPANRRSRYRLVGGDETSAGGRWQVTLPPQGEFESRALGLSEYFRARWNGALSPPVLARGPLTPFLRNPRTRRGRFFVDAYIRTDSTGQNMARRLVELQRRNTATGTWIVVRRARFRRIVGGFAAIISHAERPRGVTYRVYIPVKTARPCYDPGWTVAWTT